MHFVIQFGECVVLVRYFGNTERLECRRVTHKSARKRDVHLTMDPARVDPLIIGRNLVCGATMRNFRKLQATSEP
ncbi:hypothetical protein PPGU19_084800 (plasmid) [Paraburkholderia sp. PGU19]|nr:hypothetical protein PPGU19_084800 [Paraburkholderia sp. PGU19]